VAGLLAAGPALAALVAGRLVTDRPGLIEVISDGFSRFIPLDLFELMIATFGPLAKGLLTLGIAGGILVAGALVGDLALRATARRRPAGAGALVALVALATAELALLPLFGAGFLGADVRSDVQAVQAPIVVAVLVYAAMLIGLRETWLVEPAAGALEPSTPELPFARPTPAFGEVSRRRFVGSSLLVVGGAAFAGSIAALLSQVLGAARHGDAGASTDFPPGGFGPTPALTPVPDFYTVNKNLGPTFVDEASWALSIDGLVERPERLTLDQLRALPYQETYRTLECISTDIVRGDHLIGNQRWRGVRVSDLLDRAGVRPEASWILWEADDGFTESLPLAVARNPDTWIAYEMGGAPLTAEHGFPARVLIAGRFGMKQPKWLRRMQLADHDEAGYWEQRGWDRDAYERTMSRIDWPRMGAPVEVGVPFTAYGIAFAGDRGIDRVSVSPDGAATWLEAELEDATFPPLAELSWVRWRVELTIAVPGASELVVRANDGDGITQTGERTPSLPSGSTGWHRVEVVAIGA
jgi:DMSO/TMAO reductase YedYZ molybdopterin-dependent catalytic subunit